MIFCQVFDKKQTTLWESVKESVNFNLQLQPIILRCRGRLSRLRRCHRQYLRLTSPPPLVFTPPPAPLRPSHVAAVGSASTRPAWASPHPKRLKPLPPAPAAEEAAAAAPADDTVASGDSGAEEVDEFSHGGYAVGEEVLALGHAPAGGRAWFKARIVKLNERPVWPPLRVKYLATGDGATMALALPCPRTANVSAADVKPLPVPAVTPPARSGLPVSVTRQETLVTSHPTRSRVQRSAAAGPVTRLHGRSEPVTRPLA